MFIDWMYKALMFFLKSDEKEYKALNIVSYIGLVVSSLCLILTIMLILILRLVVYN